MRTTVTLGLPLADITVKFLLINSLVSNLTHRCFLNCYILNKTILSGFVVEVVN